MKIGLIFECGPQGADKKVCEHIIRELAPSAEVVSITLDNKPNLIENVGIVADQLLQDGCERVVVVWDLYPPWRENRQRPCRKEDRQSIMASLSQSQMAASPVYLVCIEAELESWLLADGRALSSVLSKPHRRVRIADENHPERNRNPKKRLTQIFKEHTGQQYSDRIHAEPIAKAMPDFNRVKRCSTFARFVLKALEMEL